MGNENDPIDNDAFPKDWVLPTLDQLLALMDRKPSRTPIDRGEDENEIVEDEAETEEQYRKTMRVRN